LFGALLCFSESDKRNKKTQKRKIMKKQLLQLGMFVQVLVFSFVLNAQQGSSKVMATVVNKELLTMENATWRSLVEGFGISSYEMAFPSSRTASLREVYEFTCACDEQDLLVAMARANELFVKPEVVPVFELLDMPNDYNTVFAVDYALDLINASAAWDVTKGSSEIVIAITDSNYDVLHEELAGKFSFLQSGLTNTNKDHGSAVAALAAGNTNNGVGKSSIGWNSDLRLYSMSYNSLLTATYAGAHVINASWAAGCSYSEYYQTVINEVVANGSIIVAAAGNGSTCGGASNYVYPASFQGVISVSSVGPNYNHERFEGNASSTHQHNDRVTLCAPGYDVAMIKSNNQYITGNGSSFAAPIVSGTIALMLAANPCLTPAGILEILSVTSVSLDELNPQYAGTLGFGALDAGAAVAMAAEYNRPKVDAIIVEGCVANSSSIDITIQGGTAPYAVNWNTGSDAYTLANLTSGIYTLTVVDATGCTVVENYELNEVVTEVTATVADASAYGEADGSITLVGSGAGELTYEWSTGATTESIDGLAAGSYTVAVVNMNGCAVEYTFEVAQPDQIIITQPEGEQETIAEENQPEEEEEEEVIEEEEEQPSTANITEQSAAQVNVYPNPANEVANVEWSGVQVEMLVVYDSKGALVAQEDVSFQQAYQLVNLESGMYIINLIAADGQRIVNRLIVR
jgi:subtilisin family serine protease